MSEHKSTAADRPERRRSHQDIADIVQHEISQAADRRAVPSEIARKRTATRFRLLAIFVAALAGLISTSTLSYRAMRTVAVDVRSAVQAHEISDRAVADTDRLTKMMLVGVAVRSLFVILMMLLLLRDIKRRESAEDALRRARDEALSEAGGRRVAQLESEKLGERLRAVLDHIDIGVLMVELDGSMTVYNMAAERIHGAWREQMERLKQADTHPPMFADEKTVIPHGESPLGRALKGQIVRDAHIYFKTPFRPSGYHLNVSAVPLRDHRGLMAGALMMFTERQP
jgi:PAS domain-containing protein